MVRVRAGALPELNLVAVAKAAVREVQALAVIRPGNAVE